MGQHIGALEYLLPKEYVNVMKVLHSDAPQSPVEDIQQVIKEDLGKDVINSDIINLYFIVSLKIGDTMDHAAIVRIHVHRDFLAFNVQATFLFRFLLNLASGLLWQRSGHPVFGSPGVRIKLWGVTSSSFNFKVKFRSHNCP